jgi:hypothetical protein
VGKDEPFGLDVAGYAVPWFNPTAWSAYERYATARAQMRKDEKRTVREAVEFLMYAKETDANKSIVSHVLPSVGRNVPLAPVPIFSKSACAVAERIREETKDKASARKDGHEIDVLLRQSGALAQQLAIELCLVRYEDPVLCSPLAITAMALVAIANGYTTVRRDDTTVGRAQALVEELRRAAFPDGQERPDCLELNRRALDLVAAQGITNGENAERLLAGMRETPRDRVDAFAAFEGNWRTRAGKLIQSVRMAEARRPPDLNAVALDIARSALRGTVTI